MKKEEKIYNPDVEQTHFQNIVSEVNKHNFENAANIYNDAGFCAIDLIAINDYAKEYGNLYYNVDRKENDHVRYLDNPNHLVLIVEKANELKNK